MTEYVDEEFGEAHDALSDAKKMRRAGVTDKAVVNRLYYACFHAARAVLLTNDIDPGTHQGVLRMFGKEVVVTSGATREDGRFLNDMRNYRQVADYSHDPIDVDIDELIDRTEAFVTDLESRT